MTIDKDALTVAIRRRRRDLDSLMGEARSVLLRGQELQGEVAELSSQVTVYERVSFLLNSLGEDKQQETQDRIEQLVTRGLQTIFDDSLSFHILQSTKNKTAAIDFIVRTTLSNGSLVDTPVLDARGGGLAATVGFLLRLVIMLLRNGSDKENILVLDETFAHVSAEYLDSLGQFLREVVDKTGVQITMVTHSPEFADYADKVYRFTTENGKTKVVESS